MCYILLSKRIGNVPSAAIEQRIKDVAIAKFHHNSDGYCVRNPKQNFQLRTLVKDDAKMALDLYDIDSLFLHARYGTSGTKTVDNVHGWQIGEYIFGHNGTIPDLANLRRLVFDNDLNDYINLNEGKTDSLLLFEKLHETLQRRGKGNKKIARAIQETLDGWNFWGRAFLYHTKSDRMFLFGDWYMYLLEQQYLVISSAYLQFDTKKKAHHTHGLQFQTQSTDIAEDKFDGIGLITNWSRQNFHFSNLGKLELRKFQYTHNYQKNNVKPALPVPGPESFAQPFPHRREVGFQHAESNASKPIPVRKPNPILSIDGQIQELKDKIVLLNLKPHVILPEDDDDELSTSQFIEREMMDLDMPNPTYPMVDEKGTLVEVYEGQGGILHDVANLCCYHQTCGLFFDIESGQPRTEIHREPMPF